MRESFEAFLEDRLAALLICLAAAIAKLLAS